jgi:hypothetical protein
VAPADHHFSSDGRVLAVPVEQGGACAFRMITHDFQQIAVRKNLSSGCGRTGLFLTCAVCLCSRYGSTYHIVYQWTPRGSGVLPGTRDSTRHVHQVEKKHRPTAILDLWGYVSDYRPRSDISSRREALAFARDAIPNLLSNLCNSSTASPHLQTLLGVRGRRKQRVLSLCCVPLRTRF